MLTLDNIDIHDPKRYQRFGFPWQAFDLLREQAPVFYYERGNVEPFWVVSRYQDILEVSENPEIFINGGPRLRLALKGKPEILRAGLDTFGEERNWDPEEPPDMVFMDNPRHRHMRKLSSWAFTQGAMRNMGTHFDKLAEQFTASFISDAKLAAKNNRAIDLVAGLSCKLPLAATGEILGLQPEDWKQILVWTNALVGEFGPGNIRPGESRGAAGYRHMYEFRVYLESLIHDSRENGQDRGGFIDHLVHHKVQGKLLNDQQLIGYLFLLIAAGNDTTRNAFTGGIAALIENPTQGDLLLNSPKLIPSAVEEILRWTSPVGHFLRTAVENFTLAGKQISAGDTVALFYPSANRDEQIFDNPYQFNIQRSPNAHLTFGFGAHFCLGTNLARAELKASLKALIPHLKHLKFAGKGIHMAETHAVGYSELPVTYAS